MEKSPKLPKLNPKPPKVTPGTPPPPPPPPPTPPKPPKVQMEQTQKVTPKVQESRQIPLTEPESCKKGYCGFWPNGCFGCYGGGPGPPAPKYRGFPLFFLFFVSKFLVRIFGIHPQNIQILSLTLFARPYNLLGSSIP